VEIFIVVSIVSAIVLLWLNFIAMLSIKYDPTLSKFQKNAQLIFIWIIPLIGASFIIHLVYEHSPEAIPKSWIPWPFKKMIYGKSIKSNRNRDDSQKF